MPLDVYGAYQAVLLFLCGCGLVATGAWLFYAVVVPFLDWAYHEWLRLDGLGKAVCLVCVCGVVMYGGSKGWVVPPNSGGDDGYGLASLEVQVTNIVVSAEVTNEVTMVQAHFTGSGVTEETPLWVRDSVSNEWTRVELSNVVVSVDLATNVLSGVASGDWTRWRYWWLGNSLPAVEIDIVVSGINLLRVVEGSKQMGFLFTCDDARATGYRVQYMRDGDTSWQTALTGEMATTNAVVVSGFWIDRTTRWRISSEVGGGE